MRPTVRWTALFLTTLLPLRLPAQAKPEIVPGDSLSLYSMSAKPRERTAVLKEMKTDRLVLRGLLPNEQDWELPYEKITSMRVYRADGASHAGKGALIGMVAGFVVIGTAGYLATHDGSEYDGIGVFLAAPGGGLGAIIGGLVGASDKRPGWKGINVPKTKNRSGAANLFQRGSL